jgi:hypothetical protein
MVRNSFFMMLVGAAFLACGNKPAGGTDPDNMAGDSRITLSVVGDTSLSLPPLRSATLKFAAKTTADQKPVSNLAITYKITSGDLAGSRISTESGTTSSDGTTTVRVTGGNKNTTFRVSATATDASSASVDVKIDSAAAANPTGSYDSAA